MAATLAAVMAVSMTGSALAAPPEQHYEVVDLGSLGGNAGFARGLNDEGQVTGNSRTGTTTLPLVAYAWSDGEMTEIGTLPASNAFSRGYAINNAGVVVGESDNNRSRAFRWQAGTLTDLGTLGGASAVAHGINNPGQIVGASSNGTTSRPFIWSKGEMRDLGTVAGGDATPGRAWDVNARGDVVGNSRAVGSTAQATLWEGPNRRTLGTPQTLGSLGDGLRFSEALAVNNRRWVVGRSNGVGSTERAFLWKPGAGMVELGSLGLPHSRAVSVNEGGKVVGYASSFLGFATLGTAAAFIWEGGEMTDLNELIGEDAGWELLAAKDINNAGEIAGYGRFEGQIRPFLLRPSHD